MTSFIFLLVVISAFSHAAWNFATRKIAGNLLTVWLGLWFGCAFIFPAVIFVIAYKGFGEILQARAIICIITTGLIHSLYFRLVAAVYERGEISLVYPIARGSGIALTAIIAALLLKEKISLLGSVGVGLISLGILILSSATTGTDNAKAVKLALCLGSTIVAYSLIDKVGVSYTNPVLYIWFQFLIAAIVLTPFIIKRYRNTLFQGVKQHIAYAMIIGGGSIGTYLIILFAFTIGPVGYIVAVRELSVVFGALAGIIFLKERFTIKKIVTICVIIIGNICIKIS